MIDKPRGDLFKVFIDDRVRTDDHREAAIPERVDNCFKDKVVLIEIVRIKLDSVAPAGTVVDAEIPALADAKIMALRDYMTDGRIFFSEAGDDAARPVR